MLLKTMFTHQNWGLWFGILPMIIEVDVEMCLTFCNLLKLTYTDGIGANILGFQFCSKVVKYLKGFLCPVTFEWFFGGRWVDGFSLCSNRIFQSTLMALSKWWPRILEWLPLLMKAFLRSFKCLIASDVLEHICFILKAWLYVMLSFNAFGCAG